ncbi:prepilin-type N-terminal cleavage/methylation domain-containing protein [Deinococcus cavernae]|uniref:Prepilin-type N-terminal cleavage/methylation domain-containing protein n=1 Tax=Deinococcus cavernae TaxID=2320857 RepID=A0A418VGL5_9DEIO|nr:prepilin-type N-terminal cleavage/methylation domain-containing protein [Deinococcus cavernae]RJF75275.1 prepilin-type N-terminal cleavage/methylation domain-containing protein [Deinococcus cavernae]
MSSSGFTLIEILVVIAIIGIFVTLGLVSMRPFVEIARLENSAADIAAMTRYATGEARRSNTTLTLTIDATAKKATVKRGTTVLQERTLMQTPTLTCRTAPCPAAFTFSAPFGFSAGDFKVSFSSGSRTKTVYVRGPNAMVAVQ